MGWGWTYMPCLALSLLLLHRLTGLQKRDSLVCYLLDELYYYEEGHGDALRPISRGEPVFSGGACREPLSYQARSSGYYAGTLGNVSCCRPSRDSGTSWRAQSWQHIASTPHELHHVNHTMQTSHHSSWPPGWLSMPHNLCIPTLPKSGLLDAWWKHIVQDWEEPDPLSGHYIPLKDWDWAWYNDPTVSSLVCSMGSASDAAVRFGSVQRPFLPNRDPHRSLGQLGSWPGSGVLGEFVNRFLTRFEPPFFSRISQTQSSGDDTRANR